ncbi:hypothetical protein BC833DRAFT_251490 [Globomyces pollinis-pini]|nr:hypothetical protein BC833DRAFT_251490 [Globomyces pollinis-pini]
MVNLQKLNQQELYNLSKKYFYLGLPALPFFWLINIFWIYPFIRLNNHYSNSKDILFRALIWSIIIITWLTLFLLNRNTWGVWTDSITVIVPKGI